MFIANLCVYKSKKHYNPRYMQKWQVLISIQPNFWEKVFKENSSSRHTCIPVKGIASLFQEHTLRISFMSHPNVLLIEDHIFG